MQIYEDTLTAPPLYLHPEILSMLILETIRTEAPVTAPQQKEDFSPSPIETHQLFMRSKVLKALVLEEIRVVPEPDSPEDKLLRIQ